MLKLEHIDKTYNKGTVSETILFNDFNFSIEKGQFVSVVGSNGSGKSSMLNIICGSIPIDSGRILLKDNDISSMKEYVRAGYMGRVFQNPSMGTCPSLTILENMSLADNKGKRYGLTMGVNKRKKDFYRSELSLLGLGLEDKLNVTVGALSGGQRQALSLLMSSMYHPDILLLDEHTAALDPKISDTIMQLTNKIVTEKNMTSIMVTHNLRFAVEYGNRLIMMHQGKVIVDVTDEEKKNKSIDDLLKIFNEISIELGN